METICCEQPGRSFQDSLDVLEADVQHANALAAAIPKAKSGIRLEMKLVYYDTAPLLLFFLQWMDSSCSCFSPRYLNLCYILICKVYEDGRPKMSTRGKKASIKDFYAIILPSLQNLHHCLEELDDIKADNIFSETNSKKRQEKEGGFVKSDSQKDEECGICFVPQTQIVLPDCHHSMCTNCYHNWNVRSESCPFCRDCLIGLDTTDLWHLTSKDEVADSATVYEEDLQNFYLYIRNLPKDVPEVLFIMYYEYLL